MSRTRPLTLRIFALSAALCGGACSGEGDAPSDPAPTKAPPSPEPEPEPAPVPEAAPEAVPEPAPEPEPWTAAQVEAELARASDEMKALGAYRRPRTNMRGPRVDDLTTAYAEGRALNWQGTFKEIQLWSSLAKFGRIDPHDALSRGPLAGWDLTIITRHDMAFMHAILPPTGPREDGPGTHVRIVGDRRWVALCDRAKVGEDYTPFKRDGTVSLHHQWGNEAFIDDIVALARTYKDETGVPLGIGDISHVTGGKLEGHWTHRLGVDADLYLLRYPDREAADFGPPVNYIFALRGDEEVWSTRPRGTGEREPELEDGTSLTAKRLALLAKLALDNDAIAFFVHDAASILERFDALAQDRRPGRRYLHLDNHGYWPPHPDHVHLRWAPLDKKLPTGTPRP